MIGKSKKVPALLLAILLAISLCANAFAVGGAALQNAVTGTASYILKAVPDPQVGSIGGEWAVIGLARSGCGVPDGYYQNYYSAVEKYVSACGGVLSGSKYTEYSRLILALTATGRDPANVSGFNLLTPLGDYEKTLRQGINGPVWALIALDSGGYAMPVNSGAAKQATRQMYVDEILSRQLDCGGWNLADKGGSGAADPDITGMALQALSKYLESAAVKTAADKALCCLSKMQNADGGYTSWGTANSESDAQVLTALCELGISLDDSRFVKNGMTVLDSILSYRRSDGGFNHASTDSGISEMASEQCFCGLVAAMRTQSGKTSLYRMAGTLSLPGAGLAGKSSDVRALPVSAPGASFSDTGNSKYRAAIEGLAARGIINGRGNGTFSPDETMTRAQFAAVVVRALGLPETDALSFSDVAAGKWYAGAVGTAAKYKIVSGTGGGRFEPEGTVTRAQAAVMISRAAGLCGMDTAMDASAVSRALSPYSDAGGLPAWSKEALAFCYSSGFFNSSAASIEPNAAVTRGEIAQAVYSLLSSANLI